MTLRWRLKLLQQQLRHFPVLVSRNLRNVIKAASQSLVILKARLQEVDQVLLRFLVARLENDKSPRHMSILLVGHCNDCRINNAAVGQETGLEHTWGDFVHPEGDQTGDLLDKVDDTVLVVVAKVSRVEVPLTVHDVLLLPPVAQEQLGGFHAELSLGVWPTHWLTGQTIHHLK